MPIEHSLLPGPRVQVSQSFEAPTVYLDHWAVRRLSTDSTLGERFITAMKKRRGTLVLSHMLLAEFTRITDDGQARAAGSFLDRILPNVYFMLLDLDIAIDRERTAGDARIWPPADQAMLNEVAAGTADYRSPFSFVPMLSLMQDQTHDLRQTFDQMCARLVELVNGMKEDDQVRTKAEKYKPSANKTKTEAILADLLRDTHRTPRERFDEHDAADLQHAVLSVGYCDYVLLDGKWRHRVDVMRKRFAASVLRHHIAMCFSEGGGGLEKFVTQLESI